MIGTRADKVLPSDSTRAVIIDGPAISAGRWPCTVSTESPVRLVSARGLAYDEVLSHEPGAVDLSRAPLPLLEGHDTYKTNIGIIDNLRIEGRKLRGELVLGTSPRARELAPDIERGIVSSLSVGFRYGAIVESSDGALVTVTRWTPHECSIVSCPADINAGINRSLQTEAIHEVPTRGLAPQNTKGSTMTEEELKAAQAKAAEAAVQAERARASGIRSLGDKLRLRDLAEKWVTEGVSLEAARALTIDAIAERTATVSSTSGIEVGKEASQKQLECAEAWLLEKSGKLGLIESARSIKGLSSAHVKALSCAADGGSMRGLRMLDIGRELLESSGVSTRGMSSGELAKRAMTAHFGNRAGSGFAPASDFSTLYESAMGKILLASYLTAPSTWQRVCKKETVSDTRASSRYRVGAFGTLDESGENEEIKNKSIPDGLKSSISTGKYANIIGLSREAMINDDMGANADVATRFGASFKLTLEKAFYALINSNAGLGPSIDANPFFHASRSNINTVGSALSIAGLDSDRSVMKRQMDQSNQEFLDLAPSILLVPTELGTAARQYNNMQFSDVASKYAVPNSVQGMFADIIDTPRLTGTRRYVFADPSVAPAFVMVFLEGFGEAPSMEQQEGWRTDGIEWRVKLWARCQAFDPKGALTNAGI